MGAPVSVVVAEIVMQNIEERALPTCRQKTSLWLPYVNEIFTTVVALHEHLNEQNAEIQPTREIEENGKLPFLGCVGVTTIAMNYEPQCTENRLILYWQITGRIILQPDFPQNNDYQDFDKTSATSLWHTEQFIWRKQIY